MKLLILGATGRVGRELVDLALARGHLVTAYVRTPKKLARRDRGLTVTPGDALDVDRLTAALTGQDAVLSSINGLKPGASTLRGTGSRLDELRLARRRGSRFIGLAATRRRRL